MTVSGAARGTAGGPSPARSVPAGRGPDEAAARQARERLERQRRTRTAQLVIIEHETETRGDRAALEPALARCATLRQALRDIEAALARVDAGTYGLCEDCGEPISQARLEILPHARRCVLCQQRRHQTGP
ncbi:TraR/DksA family transcriptional regulator [Actinomadura miaoliensis]|uniref:Zinc finger DksA/TraR C4-type domain-containing protein n=1 Tax=Actinomadura miaoliensis TaxID=430685 RepID=A0ABP7WAD3_9ACTN